MHGVNHMKMEAKIVKNALQCVDTAVHAAEAEYFSTVWHKVVPLLSDTTYTAVARLAGMARV